MIRLFLVLLLLVAASIGRAQQVDRARTEALARSAPVADNPTGPTSSFDPAEPGVQKHVQKGGSFLCTDQFCSRYRPGMRGKGETSSASNNVGFRCVRDAASVS